MMFRRRWIVVASAACIACSDGAAPPPPPPPTPAALHIVSARSLEDTIGAVLIEPLTVAVTDANGDPFPGAPVRIWTPTTGGVVVFGPTPNTFEGWEYDTTSDAQGIVRAYMKLYSQAGKFSVVASTGTLKDSISVTIRAGAPIRIGLTPRDTAVYVGAHYSLSVRLVDRGNNTTSRPVVFRAARPLVASADSNQVVQANATGRAYVAATTGALAESVAVSVVPEGRILAFTHRYGSGDIAKFVMFGLDGSGYRAIDTTSFAYNNRAQFFFPDGRGVVYHDVTRDSRLDLRTMDTLGTIDTLLTPTDSILGALTPQPSRDGAWIYFTASRGYERSEVWRITNTGATPTRIGPVSTQGDLYGEPSPSPDGSTLALIVDRTPLGQGVHLAVMPVATGQVQLIANTAGVATIPRWSRVGDEIAFFGDSGVTVDRSDGQRLLGPIRPPAGIGWDAIDGQLDWSSDGKWLVSCMTGAYSGDRHIVVIDRSTGELLPLAFTARERLCGATWQP